MPDSKDEEDKKIWDIVHFVQALPYPAMLPADLRQKIYGPAMTKQAE
jgi:hypothetical protein